MRRRALTFLPLAVALLVACSPAQTPEVKPLWQDEFNGTVLDTGKWTPQIGNGFTNGSEYVSGWGNNELEYYTDRPENVKVENGEERFYMIRETKGTLDPAKRRPSENAKIAAARSHFAAIGVNYEVGAPGGWSL